MWGWARRELLSVQNLLSVATLLLLLWSKGWGWMATQEAAAKQIHEYAAKLDDLQSMFNARLEALEQERYSLNDRVAVSFPRRSEIEPQLKALNEKVDDARMMTRQLLERYRRPY